MWLGRGLGDLEAESYEGVGDKGVLGGSGHTRQHGLEKAGCSDACLGKQELTRVSRLCRETRTQDRGDSGGRGGSRCHSPAGRLPRPHWPHPVSGGWPQAGQGPQEVAVVVWGGGAGTHRISKPESPET